MILFFLSWMNWVNTCVKSCCSRKNSITVHLCWCWCSSCAWTKNEHRDQRTCTKFESFLKKQDLCNYLPIIISMSLSKDNLFWMLHLHLTHICFEKPYRRAFSTNWNSSCFSQGGSDAVFCDISLEGFWNFFVISLPTGINFT